jgi:hypothetical protein
MSFSIVPYTLCFNSFLGIILIILKYARLYSLTANPNPGTSSLTGQIRPTQVPYPAKKLLTVGHHGKKRR